MIGPARAHRRAGQYRHGTLASQALRHWHSRARKFDYQIKLIAAQARGSMLLIKMVSLYVFKFAALASQHRLASEDADYTVFILPEQSDKHCRLAVTRTSI
jgi:hypothetical protein